MNINTLVQGIGPSTVPAGASSTAAIISVFNYWYGIFPSGQCNLTVPGSNRLNGQPFVVRAEGNISFAAGTYTSSVAPLLHAFLPVGGSVFGVSATAANAIYSPSAIAVTVTSATPKVVSWATEAELLGSNASGTISGTITGILNNGATQLVGPTAVINAPTGVNFLNEPPLQFAASVQIGGIANTYPLSPVTLRLETFELES